MIRDHTGCGFSSYDGIKPIVLTLSVVYGFSNRFISIDRSAATDRLVGSDTETVRPKLPNDHARDPGLSDSSISAGDKQSLHAVT